MDLAVDELADQARRFSAFTGITKPNPSDRFFLVAGATGAGKSSFIATCTGRDVTIGHGLYSCTSDIDVFDFPSNGRRIYLIDTPGFNDTTRSDMDTLGVIAAYLGASYANGVRIHGLLLLHSISDNRMAGSSLRNLDLIKAVCGFSSYENVAVATTMWPSRPSHDEAVLLNRREGELLADDRFFGSFVTRGASMFRHCANGRVDPFEERTSAAYIMAHLLRQSDDSQRVPEVLQIQREMIHEGKTLGETAAGTILGGELFRARRAHEDELRQLHAEMRSQLARSDAAHAEDLRELRADAEKKFRAVQKQQDMLTKSMQQLHEEERRAWKEKVEKMERKFRAEMEAEERTLRDLEEALRKTQSLIGQVRPQSGHLEEHDTWGSSDTSSWYPKSGQYFEDETLTRGGGTAVQLQEILRQVRELQRQVQESAYQQGYRTTRQLKDVERDVVKYEKLVEEKKTEMSRSRRVFAKIGGQLENALSGGVNGAASSLATALITGAIAGTIACSVM